MSAPATGTGRGGATAARRPATADLLAGSPVLAAARPDTVAALARVARRLLVAGGDVLVHDGETGRDVFVVVSGRLEVELGDRRAVVGPGELIGERAHLDGGVRCATVRALRDCEVLRLPASSFGRALDGDAGLLRRLSSALADRVAPRAEPRAAGARWLALVPAGGTDRRVVRSVGDALAAELARTGRVAVVDRRRALAAAGTTATAGRPTFDDARLAAWLGGVDTDHDTVLLIADPRASEWTARSLRQADQVVLVADAGAMPAVGSAERAIPAGARTDLVVVHHGEPAGAGAWLDADGRRVDAWHHLVTGSGTDVARIVRHLTGTATAVVLGGGGARGMAHLGVLAALEDAGVEIDAVAGTSIGGIMAALTAIGHGDEERKRLARQAFVDTKRLIGVTLPIVALSSTRKLTAMLQDDQYAGGRSIEDLRIPFFCVSASLSRGEAVVHDRGPLWWALRATISMPGVMPPVYADGDLLVDGGSVNILPVDVMRDRIGGRVIAVNLRSGGGRRAEVPFDPTVSGWKVLGARLRPGGKGPKMPGPAATLLRAKELAAKQPHKARLAAADVLLEPPVSSVDTLAFRESWPLVDAAHAYTRDALDALPADQGNG